MSAKTLVEGRELDVVALYPDSVACSRVMGVLRRVHAKLWPDSIFEVKCARFDHLKDEKVRESVMNNVLEADILCFAVHSSANIPVATKQWLMSLCFPARNTPPLLAL